MAVSSTSLYSKRTLFFPSPQQPKEICVNAGFCDAVKESIPMMKLQAAKMLPAVKLVPATKMESAKVRMIEGQNDFLTVVGIEQGSPLL